MALFGKRKPVQTETDTSPFMMAWRTEDGGMTVKLDPARVGSAGAAGIMLADFTRHFARALTQYGATKSEEEATAEMLRLFNAEMDSPTDIGSGSIVN
ncbi:MAG TPA: DUF5076 domain-containing protein [Rhizobiaceae bacterium]|nr:DUF5076 domain-containing protein [Rhizobiaceae bacterium]